ncbi:divergent PAP2 family protein [Salibacterium lacus]|uniref:Divergent PAP2 family protein n=1 Tax=Salibacterium lacus TaxID=1898109 RepID=A0ABW5T2J8_9BACI
MEILQNFPLWAALCSILFAQVVKIPLSFIASRKWDVTLITSTGGMPSSHSAAVTAVSMAIGFEHGFDSALFAICMVFGVIVLFDATGVRRHAGYHATVLNQLVVDFNKFVSEAKSWQKKQETEKREELKELLGHQPIEVFFGCLVGLAFAWAGHYYMPIW